MRFFTKPPAKQIQAHMNYLFVAGEMTREMGFPAKACLGHFRVLQVERKAVATTGKQEQVTMSEFLAWLFDRVEGDIVEEDFAGVFGSCFEA